MNKSRFIESPIVAILKEADASMLMKDVYRQHGISDAPFYKEPKMRTGGCDMSTLFPRILLRTFTT